MDNARAELADKLKTANNVLLSVSRDPSVDQLSALLGLALLLNKQSRHAAAVYSGTTPSIIDFLEPEATFEKNTDSLRDFIIALDKNKADKLRYKVEDDVVRIFITPYKTSLSQADFDFSQGDFNVDVVLAIGVQQQEDLDEAITAHGRILHDATVTSFNVSAEGGLGSINWHNPNASSLSEMATDLIQLVDPSLMDEQIATALLTGIVSETDRFRNEKTTAQTMSMGSTLLAAGANQQLVATKLEEPAPEAEPEEPEQHDDNQSDSDDDDQSHDDNGAESSTDEEPPKPEDGTIEISHEQLSEDEEEPEETPADDASQDDQDALDDQSNDDQSNDEQPDAPTFELPSPIVDETPTEPEEALTPMIEPAAPVDALPEPAPFTPAPAAWSPPPSDVPVEEPQAEAEPAVAEPEQPAEPAEDLNAVRDEVSRALTSAEATSNEVQPPIQALNAQPMFEAAAESAAPEPAPAVEPEPAPEVPAGSSNITYDAPAPTQPPNPIVPITPSDPMATFNPPQPPAAEPAAPEAPVVDANQPPPVPPPIPFQFGTPPQQ